MAIMETHTQKNLPKVTIALPTLNRVDYLRLALESALGQTYGNIEVIVSNNVSEDGTAAYLSACTDPRLVLLQQATLLPMTENWNACLAAATGEYFLLLSDDDILEPDAIRSMVAEYTLQDQPSPGLVYCGGRIIDAEGNTKRPFKTSPRRESPRDLITAFFDGKRDLLFCAVLLRRSDLGGGFQNTYKVACDAAAWITAAMGYPTVAFVPEPLVAYRLHGSLSSVTHLDVWRDEYRQLYALIVARDRASGAPDPAFIKRLGAIVKRIDRSLIAGRINETHAARRGKAVLEYIQYLPAFASPRGLVFWLKALAVLLVPGLKAFRAESRPGSVR